jgi:hypothetical protein
MLLEKGQKLPKGLGMLVSTRAVVPSEFRTVLRYSQRIVINNNIGLPNSYLFVGNSVFDPDFSGTGSQPLGFDQLAGLYSRYRVLGSTITVDMMTPSAGTNQSASINAVVCATNQSTGFTQVDPAAA